MNYCEIGLLVWAILFSWFVLHRLHHLKWEIDCNYDFHRRHAKYEYEVVRDLQQKLYRVDDALVELGMERVNATPAKWVKK